MKPKKKHLFYGIIFKSKDVKWRKVGQKGDRQKTETIKKKKQQITGKKEEKNKYLKKQKKPKKINQQKKRE